MSTLYMIFKRDFHSICFHIRAMCTLSLYILSFKKTGRFGDGPPGVRGEQATMAGVLGARRATAGHGHLEGRAAAAGHGVRADRGLCRACLRVGLLRICFGSVQGFF